MPKVDISYVLTYLLGNSAKNRLIDSLEGIRPRMITHGFMKPNVPEGIRFLDSLQFRQLRQSD
jgi:hypothetical protein